MKAIDVMSAPAIVVFPDMTIKEAASILAGHRISGAPVVDRASGRLVGMLSEGDLLRADRKAAGGAIRVAEVMASSAIAVDHTTEINEVATRLLEANVHRVPVLAADAVVGVVSRHDLLRHLCRSDAAVTVEVANLLKEQGTALARMEVEVKDGIAVVRGEIGARTGALALELARTVPGVLGAQLSERVTLQPGWLEVAG